MNLPQEFLERMRRMLGEEYETFLQSYQESRRFGLRVNTLKISADAFVRLAPFHLKKIPWTDNGFYYEREDDPARHPFYYAGLYYLQEPSAMMPAAVLPVTPGQRVLDLCAAPGGKATALAAKLQGRGLLVANEISASRAKALLKNLEIFGVTNSFVTNAAPYQLEEQFPESFDRILVDAPCSGEGMFRKDMANARAWSLDKVEACAKIQREITLQAVRMLKPGGLLLYSTCTFSPEENEGTIAYLLSCCPELELLNLPAEICGSADCMEAVSGGIRDTQDLRTSKLKAEENRAALNCPATGAEAGEIWGMRDCLAQPAAQEEVSDMRSHLVLPTEAIQGRPDFLALLADPDMPGSCGATYRALQDAGMAETDLSVLTKCVRIFPHRVNGEGHFLALLTKKGRSEETFRIAGRDELPGEESSTLQARKTRMSESDGRAPLREPCRITDRKRAGAAAGKTGSVKEDRTALEDFFRNVHTGWETDKLEVRGGKAYYVPESLQNQSRLPFLRNGLYLGELRKGRFEPSQAFAMALGPGAYDSVIDFEWNDPRVHRYLCGETVEADDLSPAHSSGWQLVCVCGYPLGWGKLVNGTLKNKYHPGWRVQA